MTQSPSLPELPKPAELLPCPFCGGAAHCHDYRGGAGYWQVECQDCDATTDGRRIKSDAIEVWNRRTCYEAGSAAAAQAAWQPIATAPHGVRVLLGPREAPVVGIVKHPPEWEEERDPVCSVVHYNGNVFVAGYHCSEWMPLPAAPTQGAEGAAPQAVVREASEAVGAQIEALTALADTYVDAGITYQGNPNALTVAALDTARSAFINAARAALAQHQPQQGEAA